MDWTKFGQDMKKAREKKGLLQSDIAKMLDITPTMVSYIEQGKKKTSTDNVIKISKLLDINFF